MATAARWDCGEGSDGDSQPESAAPIWIDSLLQKQRAMITNETCTLDELRGLLDSEWFRPQNK